MKLGTYRWKNLVCYPVYVIKELKFLCREFQVGLREESSDGSYGTAEYICNI